MTESRLGKITLTPRKLSPREIATRKTETENATQGDPSGQRMHFVDFGLIVHMYATFCFYTSNMADLASRQHG